MLFIPTILLLFIGNVHASKSFNVHMILHQDVLLNCSASNPTWHLHNSSSNTTTEITNGGNYIIDDQINQLIIKNISVDYLNNCEFICSGNNESYTFVPLTAPIFVPAAHHTFSVTEGGYIHMTCVLSHGFNEGQIVSWAWSFVSNEDEEPPKNLVSNNDTIVILIKDNNSKSEIIIRKINSKMGEGRVNCMASNQVGNTSQHAAISVRSKLSEVILFLGILCEVAVVCGVILFIEKKQEKKKRDRQIQFAANFVAKEKESINNENNEVKKRSIRL